MKHVLTSSLIAALVLSCSTSQKSNDPDRDPASTTNARRGNPAYFDPGPLKGSEWAKLFGSTPNYRGIGDSVLSGSAEKFRWVFGPMWYRGRLGENQVKIFAVGQEGAQDENLSNRAFTGSTGTKTQKFLNHFGIRYSYLFLNTFVYTINGQLEKDAKFTWLEQNPESPIVKYRHSLFDNVAKQNKESLALILGVGSGGKASVATWINANGGKCSVSRELAECDTTGVEKKFGLKQKLLVIGVPHPGGANPNNGGEAALQNIIRGFNNAAQRVAKRIDQDPDWLPVDYEKIAYLPGESKTLAKRGDFSQGYKYGNAPVPFWDFAFGTNWRLGAQGTASNRRGTEAIQVFSEAGQYNPPRNLLTYPRLTSKETVGIPEMQDYKTADGIFVGDLPYESPKHFQNLPERVNQYDYGPCGDWVHVCELSSLLQGQKEGYEWPDFASLGVTSHPSFGHGPIYRGNLKEARLLVLADQFDHDDFFSARALTGEAGQKLQSFLKAAGFTKSYAIIRTLPVDTLDLNAQTREAIVLNPQVSKVRNEILQTVSNQSDTQVVLTLGDFAEAAFNASPLKGKVTHFHLSNPKDAKHVAQWNDVLGDLKKSNLKADSATGSYSGQASTVARKDLPVHTRWWMGTSGDRAQRPINNETKKIDNNHYLVSAPLWVKRLRPIPAKVKLTGFDPNNTGSGDKDPEEGGD